MRQNLFVVVMTAAALLTGKTSGGAAKPSEEIRLDFSGTAGTAFAADCTLMTMTGDVPFHIEAETPFQKSLQGFGLKCEIVKQSGQGVLAVEARKGRGSVSKSATSGARGRIILSLQ